MSDIGIMTDLGTDVLTWFLVIVVLGGPAAVAMGRALARAWRPFGHAIVYTLILTGFVDFLCYALFDLAALPLGFIVDRVATQNYVEMAMAFVPSIVTMALLMAFAYAGWRVTRARQMRRQYPFLFNDEAKPIASSHG